MKSRLIKAMCLLVIASLVFGVSACGSNAEKSGTSSNASTQGTKEKTELTLWHVWPEGTSASAPPMQRTLESLSKKFPDVNISVDAIADSGDSYKTKIKAAVAADEAPDIFFTWGGGWSQAFVDSGKVLQLDSYLNDGTQDKIVKGTLSLLTYDDKVYALPTSVNVAMLYCNTELFEQNGLELPKTYEDLVNVCKAFRAKGITPLSVGGKDKWTVCMYHNGLALKTAGAQYCNDALAGKATFDTPQIKKSVEMLQELYKIGAFPEGALGINRDEGNVPFYEGQIPMLYNGSWEAADIYKSEKVKDKIKAINMPVVAGGDGVETDFLGGADQTFMINAKTADKDKTVEVYKYMLEELSKERYIDGVGAPAWKINYDTSKMENKLLLDIVEQYSKATNLTLWWNTVLTGKNAQDHEDLVIQALVGKITPDQFAASHRNMKR